ncbi:MAG TPA: cytochrome c oxidase assembly protein [Micromonosporaceae bacterium]|nr:cytochrome c oxidase assembly protein [Micromonosporaceae bacterium]
MVGAGDVLTAWELDTVPTAGIVLVGLGYGVARRRLHRTDHSWAPRRDVAFVAGLLALLIAVDGPPDAYADVSFAVHMAQHLLIQLVAAPLLLLAAPVTLLLRADPPWLRRRMLVRVLRTNGVHMLTRPAVTFTAFAAVLVGSHLSPVYDLALRNDTVHAIEHAAYLATALLFWWPAVGVDPGPAKPAHAARLLYVLLVMPVMAFLGVAIASTDRVLYPHYAAHPPPWGATALQDQHLAGTLMWVSGMVTIPPVLVLMLLRWLAQDDRMHARTTVATANPAQIGRR